MLASSGAVCIAPCCAPAMTAKTSKMPDERIAIVLFMSKNPFALLEYSQGSVPAPRTARAAQDLPFRIGLRGIVSVLNCPVSSKRSCTMPMGSWSYVQKERQRCGTLSPWLGVVNQFLRTRARGGVFRTFTFAPRKSIMLAFACAAMPRNPRRRWVVNSLVKKLFLSLFLWAIVAYPAFAATGPDSLISNIAGRTTISLDGTWKYIVDPYSTGFNMRLYENRKPKDKSELVEYDFDAAGSLKVPGDWNSQREDLLLYEGPVWYRKTFAYHKRAHTRCFLYFGSANYQAMVYLDGKTIGEHVGGFTPFNFEVTDQIAEGDNFLVVAVSDVRRPDGIPAPNTDWWNYGGITRDVSLVEVPEIFIQDSFIQLAKGSSNEIAGWVKLNGAKKAEELTLEIPEAGIHQTFTTNAEGHAEFKIPAKLEL